jgi:hypothetical protein
MRTLSTYVYLTALCISNTVTFIFAIIVEIEPYIKPDRFNCRVISVAKALTSTTIALSTW